MAIRSIELSVATHISHKRALIAYYFPENLLKIGGQNNSGDIPKLGAKLENALQGIACDFDAPQAL